MSEWFRSYGFADVHDGLIIGAYPLDRGDVQMLGMMGIRQILNLVEDGEYPPGAREVVTAALEEKGIQETRMRLTDYGRLPADKLEEAVGIVARWLSDGTVAYIHCRAGWQRSAAVAIGAVAINDGISLDQAQAQVQRRKPSADPLPHQRQDMRAWWDGRNAVRSED